MTDWEAALARLRLASPRPNFIVAGSMDIGGGVMRFDPSYSGTGGVPSADHGQADARTGEFGGVGGERR